MKSLMLIIVSLFVGFLLLTGGCAKDSGKIAAAYVSPLEYQDYNCSQLGGELSRVGRRVQEISGMQDEEAGEDAWVMGIGMVLFWPSLFFLEGNTGREAELGRLKGEIDAIEQAATLKDCHSLMTRIEKGREEARKRKAQKDEAKK